MGKLNQNFTTWKGNYRQIEFFIEDVADLTGYSAEWACSVDVDSAALVSKSSPSSGITLADSIVTVTLDPSDTSAMTAGDYYHELRLVDGSTNPSTPAIGTMTLKEVILDGS